MQRYDTRIVGDTGFEPAASRSQTVRANQLRQSPVCIYCTKFEPISKTNDAEKAPRTALQVFGQCVGLQYGLGFAKTIFLGEGFGKTSADFVFAFVRAEEGSEEESARAFLVFWRATNLTS